MGNQHQIYKKKKKENLQFQMPVPTIYDNAIRD